MARPRHPEATADEECIGNIYRVDFRQVGWRTKRLGKVPYGQDGKRLKGGNMRPVFVQRSELDAAQTPIPDTGPIDHRW